MPSQTILLALLVAWLASLAAVGTWQHGAGVTAERGKWQAAQIKTERAARTVEQAGFQKYERMIHAATEREIKNRAAVAAAERAAAGLRDTVGNLRRQLSTATIEAARNTAGACLDVFGDCTSRYRALAEEADRHANDAMTCQDAWPERK